MGTRDTYRTHEPSCVFFWQPSMVHYEIKQLATVHVFKNHITLVSLAVFYDLVEYTVSTPVFRIVWDLQEIHDVRMFQPHEYVSFSFQLLSFTLRLDIFVPNNFNGNLVGSIQGVKLSGLPSHWWRCLYRVLLCQKHLLLVSYLQHTVQHVFVCACLHQTVAY